MSTFSAPETGQKRVHLEVLTHDDATEIFVIDAQLNLAARGVGRLETDLEPGIYKVKARAGLEAREDYVILHEGDPAEVKDFGIIQFPSPAPIVGTAKTHEYQMSAAAAESRRVHVTAGQGSFVFVFARDWTSADQSQAPAQTPLHPARGLSLRDAQDNVVVDFGTQSASSLAADPWSACNVQVNPGLYRLSLDLPSGARLEQTIVASPGWQTQVFALQHSYRTGPDDRGADLPSASIFLSRGGFDPDGHDMRLVEMARLGLINERKVVPKEVLELVGQKYDDPMLGIYGAHLLLLDPQPDLGLLSTVVQNLRRLVRVHPDVEAIALKLASAASSFVFAMPPMLRRSWSLVLDATVQKPDLVPLVSPAARVASRLWGPGPWLLWMNPPEGDSGGAAGASPGARPELDEIKEILQAQLSQLKASPQGDMPSYGVEIVWSMFSGSGGGLEMAQSLQPALDDDEVKQLVQSLGIPRGNVQRLLDELAGKTGSQ